MDYTLHLPVLWSPVPCRAPLGRGRYQELLSTDNSFFVCQSIQYDLGSHQTISTPHHTIIYLRVFIDEFCFLKDLISECRIYYEEGTWPL